MPVRRPLPGENLLAWNLEIFFISIPHGDEDPIDLECRDPPQLRWVDVSADQPNGASVVYINLTGFLVFSEQHLKS